MSLPVLMSLFCVRDCVSILDICMQGPPLAAPPDVFKRMEMSAIALAKEVGAMTTVRPCVCLSAISVWDPCHQCVCTTCVSPPTLASMIEDCI